MGTPSRGMFGTPSRSPKRGPVRSLQSQKKAKARSQRLSADSSMKMASSLVMESMRARFAQVGAPAKPTPLRGSGASRSTGTAYRPMLKGTVVLTGTGKKKRKKKATKKGGK